MCTLLEECLLSLIVGQSNNYHQCTPSYDIVLPYFPKPSYVHAVGPIPSNSLSLRAVVLFRFHTISCYDISLLLHNSHPVPPSHYGSVRAARTNKPV